MPWHPPIPFGALYTEDALRIGAALSLLGYCYDKVDRDGRLRLNLRVAAGEMGVPYPTLKRWWGLLKDTEFITSYQDHGRVGVDLQMTADWLDWARENGTETGSEMIPINGKRDGNGIRNDPIPAKTGRKWAGNGIRNDPNGSMYKVLMTHDQESHERGRDLHRAREDREGTERARAVALKHPALALMAEYYPDEQLDATQIERICATATDGAVWRSVVELFHSNGWVPLIGNLLDRYRREVARGGKVNGNGKHLRSHNRHDPDWQGTAEADPDEPF